MELWGDFLPAFLAGKNGRSAEAKKMTREGEGADLSDEGGGRYSQFA